jgi:hypothetical protein
VKPQKCQSAPNRIAVIRTFMKDYAEALDEQQKQDPHSESRFSNCVLVYTDESYIHQVWPPY